MPWNRESLKNIVRDKIGEHKFIVVSNREPFIHTYTDKGIRCITPASGMTVALHPVMAACGGTWVASGMGDADRETADDRDHVLVPPQDPRYTLRRVWLTKEEEEGFYTGYSNQGLWPLCHIVHVRPQFQDRHWDLYRKVNARFAEVVLEEMGDDTGFVFIQDYHFALLPRLIKEKRPEIVVAQFWHIPWPNPEAFRVCPQAEELLHGLLGNDILGFHIQYHGLNFLDSVDRFLEARVDRERFSVVKGGRETLVRPFPISIDFERVDRLSRDSDIALRASCILNDYRIKDRFLGLGVDRIDYTKGIVERFKAVDRFLEKYPAYRERFVFLQMGPMSRILIPRYKDYNDEIYHLMVDINERWRVKNWQPLMLQKMHFDFVDVVSFYRAADLCIVSSIHDGMNLVAKEFVASRFDDRGVLILSQFTGSARELESSLLVNPLDTERFADAIHQALEMDESEKIERMSRMREVVRENNVYRWAGRIIHELQRLI